MHKKVLGGSLTAVFTFASGEFAINGSNVYIFISYNINLNLMFQKQ